MTKSIHKRLGRPISILPTKQRLAYSPRTDLAIEAREMMVGKPAPIEGLDESEEHLEGITITRVHVKSKVAERKIGKKKGRYITLEAPGLRRRDPDLQERVTEAFANELKSLIQLPERASILVIGLGNRDVTPDALGPQVVQKLFVTRHLFHYMPQILGDGKGYRSVSAVAPGVLGITGIETSEIVQGLVENMRPDAVIVIDALAARSLSRVNSTIQIADSGIQPGAGVGNHRKPINQETLGIPVLAIGIPTVVEAATIAGDTIELVLEELRRKVPGNAANAIFDRFNTREKVDLVREVLTPVGHNLVVTPKEIDEFLTDMAKVVAQGLNVALHPAMTLEDAALFMH